MQEHSIQNRAEHIRDVIRYISKFKNAAVVIYFDDRIIGTPMFTSHIRDISLIHEAGLQVLLVPGAHTHIDNALTEHGITWTIRNGCRITDDSAMPLIKTAAFEVSNKVMTSLAACNLTAVIGNWVRARGKGVLDGVDYGTSGEIDKIDDDTIRRVLSDGFIPIFPCIGWSLAGKPYNISSMQLASQIATHLKADKLFFLVPEAEISNKNFIVPSSLGLSPEGCIPAMNIEELDVFLSENADTAYTSPSDRQIASLPTRKEALALFKDAVTCNPGPWEQHSLNVATAAERIASQCGMDAEKAYICALLHDIGRKFGKGHLQHVQDGYNYLMKLGYTQAARIALSHSFQNQTLSDYIGNVDIPAPALEKLSEQLAALQYDDYDRLIQLCDSIATAESITTLECRRDDIQQRYGAYPEETYKKNYELKAYFEAKMNADLYAVANGNCFTWNNTAKKSASNASTPAEGSAENTVCTSPKLQENIISMLHLARSACIQGVTRVHILNSSLDGTLPCEIFSNLGSGTMIYSSNYGKIRQMYREDVAAVLSLIRPFVQRKILLPRTEEQLTAQCNDYCVYELDGAIRACAALHVYDDAQAEIAAVAVDESCAHIGIGPKIIAYLIEKAQKLCVKSVFVLTTQTSDWFEKQGFINDNIATLPEKRKKLWSPERGSKLLRLPLQ